MRSGGRRWCSIPVLLAASSFRLASHSPHIRLISRLPRFGAICYHCITLQCHLSRIRACLLPITFALVESIFGQDEVRIEALDLALMLPNLFVPSDDAVFEFFDLRVACCVQIVRVDVG